MLDLNHFLNVELHTLFISILPSLDFVIYSVIHSFSLKTSFRKGNPPTLLVGI